MLEKLAGIIATTKGTAAAVVIAGSAVTGGTMANTEMREALVGTVTTVTQTVVNQVTGSCSKPEDVAQRNAADARLRAAFKESHKALTALRGGKEQDNKAVNDVVKTAEKQLKADLASALDDVAALTGKGRVGHTEDSDLEEIDFSETDPTSTTSVTPKPGCPNKEDVELAPELAELLEATLDKFEATVDQAKDDVAALPASERGKPEERTKPEKGRSENKGKPANSEADSDDSEDGDDDSDDGDDDSDDGDKSKGKSENRGRSGR